MGWEDKDLERCFENKEAIGPLESSAVLQVKTWFRKSRRSTLKELSYFSSAKGSGKMGTWICTDLSTLSRY